MHKKIVNSLICSAVLASLTLVAPLAHASKEHPVIGF